MNAYVPASLCYGVNNSNRKANRHFFGMGNNLIVGGSLPNGADMARFGYGPSAPGSMNNTHTGFSPQKGPEPSSGPYRYQEDKSNGTAEQMRTHGSVVETNLDHTNAKSLDKLDR